MVCGKSIWHNDIIVQTVISKYCNFAGLFLLGLQAVISGPYTAQQFHVRTWTIAEKLVAEVCDESRPSSNANA
jgi:hypothetical protein